MATKKVTFLLKNTTVAAFVHWLSEHTQPIHLSKFPPQFPAQRKGYFALQPVRLPAQKISERPIVLNIICSYHMEDKGATPDYPEFWAIRFKAVPVAPNVEVIAECNHAPVMGYFARLLKDIESPFQKLSKVAESMISGWPDKIEVKSIELEHTTKPLPFDRWEIYDHLRALCDYDARFLVHRPEIDNDLEKLTVLDAHAIRRACMAREATIGTVRLLPEESGIAIKLVAKDAPFHAEHPNRGKSLFRTFIWRVNRHFDELTRQQVQTEPTTADEDGTPEPTPPSSEESLETDIDRLLSDLPTMRQYYKDYNPVTAKEIVKAIPAAWTLWSGEGGRWGPGYIARVCALSATTIGRYLAAFKKAGLREIDGIEIP